MRASNTGCREAKQPVVRRWTTGFSIQHYSLTAQRFRFPFFSLLTVSLSLTISPFLSVLPSDFHSCINCPQFRSLNSLAPCSTVLFELNMMTWTDSPTAHRVEIVRARVSSGNTLAFANRFHFAIIGPTKEHQECVTCNQKWSILSVNAVTVNRMFFGSKKSSRREVCSSNHAESDDSIPSVYKTLTTQ